MYTEGMQTFGLNSTWEEFILEWNRNKHFFK